MPALRLLPASLGMIIAASTLWGTVEAAQWYAQGRVGDELFFEDNVGFTADDKIDSFGTLARAGLTLGGRSRTLDVSLEGSVSALRYLSDDAQGLDSNNQYLTLRGTHRGQRSEIGLEAGYVRDRTRADEVNNVDAFVLDNQRRETVSVQPSFSYVLTPTQRLALNGLYQDVNFPTSSDTDELRFQDYTQYGGGVTWIAALSQRLAAGIGLNGYVFDGETQTAQEVGIQGIVQYDISRRVRVDARVGPSLVQTETDVAGGSDDDLSVGYFADSGLTWLITPRTEAQFRAASAVEPNGTGDDVVQRTRLSLNLRHDLTEHVQLGLVALVQRSEAIGGGSSDDVAARDFVRVEPSVRWSLTEDVDLSLLYRLRYQEFGTSNETATANAVLVRLDLRLPELRASW